MRYDVTALFAVFALTCSVARGETIEARLDWARLVDIGISTSGKIQQMTADVGQRVAGDALLVQIDDTAYRHKLKMRESTVERTRTDAEETNREYQRQRELYDAGSLSTVDLDRSEQAYIRARTDHDRALAALESARYRLGQTRLHAPFEAWIVEQRLEAGETVNTEQQVAIAYVLAPANHYAARAQVSVAVMGGLTPGMDAFVEVAGNRYPGVLGVVHFPDAAFDSPASYTIAVRFDARGARLLPGTSARIILP